MKEESIGNEPLTGTEGLKYNSKVIWKNVWSSKQELFLEEFSKD